MTSKNNLYIGLGMLALSFATVALSEEIPLFLSDEIVVTATRIPQKLSDTLRAVTIINAKDIEQSGQLTLAQVLQQFGGVEISSSGGHGSAASIFIRGANSAHTLVLIDGQRIASATALSLWNPL